MMKFLKVTFFAFLKQIQFEKEEKCVDFLLRQLLAAQDLIHENLTQNSIQLQSKFLSDFLSFALFRQNFKGKMSTSNVGCRDENEGNVRNES